MGCIGIRTVWAISACCLAYILTSLPAYADAKLSIPKPEFNFGTVSQGSKVVHDFEIKNTGSKPLVIQRVVPSCGCTASTANKSSIAPGESGQVHVEFDSKGFSGRKVKTVRVYTNDLENPTTVLTLRGVISPDVVVEPKRVFFGDVVVESVKAGEAFKEVTIAVQGSAPLRLGNVRTHSKKITIEQLKSSSVKKTLRIGLSSDVGLGEVRDRVIVDLIGGTQRSLNIPIFASVKGSIRLKPGSLAFGILNGNKPIVRSVKLENLGKDKIQLGKISSSHPAVSGSVKEIEAGRLYVLNVAVDPGKVRKDLRALLDIQTSSELQNKLSLSVFGVLPPKL